MFASVKTLVHWKSEHDEQTCEDAVQFDAAAGLFAVADGVGTAAFSNIWARIVVQHFLAVPLMGDDPFEVEWWLRLAQEEYRKQAPDLAALRGAARKKAQEGSYTTLVALRVWAVEGERVQADLRAFGDSCVLVRRAGPGEADLRFPLTRLAEFERGPVCLPSYLRRFDRHFTRCLVRSTSFAPGDQVMLATDAVAKWVMGGGGRGEAFYRAAFQEVARQREDEWPDFIRRCRARGEMEDDDVTALVVTFERDGTPGAQEVGATVEHAQEVQEARRRAFEDAQGRQDREALAIAYGDGRAFGNTPGQFPEAIVQARAVADALLEVRQALRGAINSPDPQAIVGPIWRKHQALLEQEVCAQEIVESLRQNGLLTPPAGLSALGTAPSALGAVAPGFSAAPVAAQTSPAPPPLEPLPDVPAPVPGAARPEQEARVQQWSASPELAPLPVNPRLHELEQAVMNGDVREIGEVFQRLNLRLDEVPDAWRGKVEAVMQLVRAFAEDSPQADQTVVQAYHTLSNVPGNRGRFVLDGPFERRVQQAQRRLQAPEQSWRVYCTVNGRPVMMKRMDDLEALRSWYVTWRYRELGKELQVGGSAAAQQEWDDLGEMRQHRPEDVLVDDCLIQEGIESESAEGRLNRAEFEAYLQDQVRRLLLGLRKEAANDPAVQRLTEAEMRAVLEVFVRRRKFVQYLEEQRGEQLRRWLKRQKKEADVRALWG